MMLDQTSHPMWAGRGARQPRRNETLASPTLRSNVSCSSCGRHIEPGEALCPGCGRVVLIDVTLTNPRPVSAFSWKGSRLFDSLSNLTGDRHDN